MLYIVFFMISPAALGATLPGNAKACIALILSFLAALKSTPPGREAKSIITAFLGSRSRVKNQAGNSVKDNVKVHTAGV